MPEAGPPNREVPADERNWDDAPCALLVLDEHDRVTAANASFLRRTGHTLDQVVGTAFWNELLATGSRVLYQTQLAPILELDGALDEVMVDLRTAAGARVPALLNAHAVLGADGRRAATRIALMGVPDRRGYENELRRARDEAEQARADADLARAVDAQARRRLEFLGRANTVLTSSGDVEVMLGRLTRVLVADFADWCVIYSTDADEPDVMRWSAAHADASGQQQLESLAGRLPAQDEGRSALCRVIERGEAVLVADLAGQQSDADSARVLAGLAQLGIASALLAPCNARAAGLGAIVVARRPGRPAFTTEDLLDLTDLAARTGLVIDTLRRTAREHSNSVALQQALLTAAPRTSGLQIVTRYVPATSGNEIGGDWYDAFLQPDGTPVFAIGDVVGHDILAAAAMGHLRGVIRTVGYTTGATPAEILSRSDAAARGLGVDVLATTVMGRIESRGGDDVALRWSNAGHPPPVLISDETPRLLDARPDRPLGLGARLDRPRHDHRVPLKRGDILLLYTDGLVERLDEDLDTSFARLLGTLRQASGKDLEDLCDLALAEHSDGARDDIALLAVRVTDHP